MKTLLLLLAVPLLWWAFQNVPLTEILTTIQRINPEAILGLVLLNVIIFILLTGRWWLVIRTLGDRLPFLVLTGYRLAAFGITYFTPGPQFGGEPLQVHLVRSRHDLSVTSALAGVTLDKLVELLVNFSFLIFGLILLLQSKLLNIPSSSLPLSLSVGFLTLPTAYLLLLWKGYSPVSSFLTYLVTSTRKTKAFIQVRQATKSTEEQISWVLRDKPGALIRTLILSLLIWILMVAEYWMMLRILGIRFEATQTIIVLTAARIAFLLPFPAGLGALEAGQVTAMQMLGIEPALGISVSLLIRARDLSLAVLGLWLGAYLTRLGSLNSSALTLPLNIIARRRNRI
jgi:uncharacterized protein (TIRG00374 family)